MKRIIIISIIVALTVSGFAQNKQSNPATVASLNDVFVQQPFWTAELNGGFGYTMQTYWQPITQIGNGSDSIPYLGIDVTVKPYFYSVPRITAGFSNLYLSAAFYFDINKNSIIRPNIATYGIGYFNQPYVTPKVFADIGITFRTDAFTYNNTLYMDIENAHGGANLFFIENNLQLAMNNISAYIATLSSWDGTLTSIKVENLIVTNAWLSIKDLFSSMSILVGGTDFTNLRITSVFAKASHKERILEYFKTGFFITPFVTQQTRKEMDYYYGMAGDFTISSIDGMFNVITPTSTIPILTSISLQKSIKIPLTIYLYTPLPGNSVTAAKYFNLNYVTIALSYEIPGAGILDAGWIPGIGYTIPGIAQRGTSWYSPVSYHDHNVFFVDAKLNFATFKELTVLTGAECILSTFYNQDPVQGTGTFNDPYVSTINNSFEINFGFETTYKADVLLKNLEFGIGFYINYSTGKNYQNMNTGSLTFDQHNEINYPATSWVLLSSYTEENYIKKMYYDDYPLAVYFKTNYDFNNFSLSFQNLFIKLRGKIDGSSEWWNVNAPGVKRPLGYYDTDTLMVSGTYKEGLLSVTASLRYTFYLGLPGISELGYTDAIAQSLLYYNAEALYNDKAPFIIKYPWDITITYTVTY